MTLPGIPRLYTALIEWAGCLLYILPLRKRVTGARLYTALGVGLLALCGIQLLAGIAPLYLWMAGMALAVAAMFALIRFCCDVSLLDVGFCCVRAFIFAEFTASLEWQIHYFCFPDGRASGFVPTALMLATYAVAFAVGYFFELRHTPKSGRLMVRGRELWSTALIGLAIFLLSNMSFVYQNTPFSVGMGSEIFYVRTLIDLAGVLALYAQQEQRQETALRRDLHAMDDVLRRQYEVYRASQESEELIARQHHDLKHQIAVIRAESDPAKREAYLREMDAAIKQYEAANKTGNRVLDIVLSAKALHCAKQGINFTCVADGAKLDFMEVMDICTIFGNALDNAIESVAMLPDPQKRVVSMAMFAQNEFAVLRFENYCETALVMEDGIPVTTKPDSRRHGYGIKSIRQTVERYGGSLTIHTEANWFTLHVLIPLPR